jgi:serine/threonine protein kinase/tetratricopeptide (TPR) repeat protein
MTNAHKRSLDQIVREAQTLPPGEQLRFIREACASDDVPYDSAMAQLHSRQEWFEDDQVAEDEPPRDPAGELIGPYRILSSLGQGGMGEVFLAERADDQFRQLVAIKLVRRGLLSRHVQSRLRQERQILASLEHPNIARLYGGGATSDGTPYIVMEYVDGEPIDVYCDKHGLTIEQRLRLFMTVCSAVHRAHQNLIVHRDLKPSNILVTPQGVPKLLDFGIAKLLDDREMMHTMAVTQADVRVMTPDHASPEQIRGDTITTASDVYVLGVLLYELLSGYKPFVLRGNRLAELERAICEDTPLTLSATVATAQMDRDSGIEEIARQRSVSVAKLRRELRGDLGNIVTMAMRKEPERRYSSVEQFSADIDHYLDDEPVLARADAWTYRAGKFVRRHALVVTLSAAVVALLIGFTATTFVQSQRIRHERDVAQTERARAQGERSRAEEVSTFLIESFKLADPSQSRGKDITAREILDNGAVRITRELRAQPALQATLLDTIGNVYLGLGQAADAQPLIEQALSIRRALAPESEDVASSLYSLNQVYERKGDVTTSEALARQSLAMNIKLSGDNSLQTAVGYCSLGKILELKSELTAAEQAFQKCLQIRIALLGKENVWVTRPLDNLARIAQQRNDYARAESLLREALQITRRTLGDDHPLYVSYLKHLAELTYDMGDLRTAEQLSRQSLELHRRVMGAEHPDTIDAMSSMGIFLLNTQRLEEAQQLLQEVLDLDRRLRPNHSYVGNDLENLGRLAFKRRRFEEAQTYLRDALRIYEKTYPPGSGFIATTWTLLGRSLLEQQRPKEAEVALQSATDSWKIEYDPRHPSYAMARASLGRAKALQGRLAEAEPALLESYPIILRSTRARDRELADTVHQWIDSLYQEMGKPEAAQKYFAQLDAAQR